MPSSVFNFLPRSGLRTNWSVDFQWHVCSPSMATFGRPFPLPWLFVPWLLEQAVTRCAHIRAPASRSLLPCCRWGFRCRLGTMRLEIYLFFLPARFQQGGCHLTTLQLEDLGPAAPGRCSLADAFPLAAFGVPSDTPRTPRRGCARPRSSRSPGNPLPPAAARCPAPPRPGARLPGSRAARPPGAAGEGLGAPGWGRAGWGWDTWEGTSGPGLGHPGGDGRAGGASPPFAAASSWWPSAL